MLIKMKRIDRKELAEIYGQFAAMDSDNSGTLTVEDIRALE